MNRGPDPDGFDVVVVGAGIVGLAHALAAARRGLSVAVIERDPRCLGASIRNFGFVTVTGQRAGPSWDRARRSRDIWQDLAAPAGIDIVHRHLYLPAWRDEAIAVLDQFLGGPTGADCRLLGRDEIARLAPSIRVAGARALLFSPHELRVESRTALPALARWLAEALGVRMRFGEAVIGIDGERVTTSRGTLAAERVVICTHTALTELAGERLASLPLTRCRLQMSRVRPDAGFRLPGAVMSELSLIRYAGYADLPGAAALRARLEDEAAATLADGIHLIAVQSADGSLVVGDSHHYDPAPLPFASAATEGRILAELQRVLALERVDVVERWTGCYVSSPLGDVLVDAPTPGVRRVIVTAGNGASTAFGLAEDVFDHWDRAAHPY